MTSHNKSQHYCDCIESTMNCIYEICHAASRILFWLIAQEQKPTKFKVGAQIPNNTSCSLCHFKVKIKSSRSRWQGQHVCHRDLSLTSWPQSGPSHALAPGPFTPICITSLVTDEWTDAQTDEQVENIMRPPTWLDLTCLPVWPSWCRHNK